MYRLPLRLALTGTTILGFAGSAFAFEGADLLAKINKNYEASGAVVTAENIAVDGGDVTMTGVTYKPSAEAKPVKIGDVNLSGVEEDDAGNYTIDEVKFPDVDSTQDKTTVKASGLTLSGVFIPATPGDKSLDSLAPFESANSGPITISEDGKEVASLGSMEATATVREDESGVDYSWDVHGLKMDLTNTPDPKTKDAIEKLNLQQVEGDVSLKSSWDQAKGTSTLENFTLDLKDVGKLNIAMSISGLTLDLIKQLEEASKAAGANKDAAGLQFMGLMQQLTFDSAQIRFDDASITKRALDYAGQQQGVTGEQLAQSLKAMAPLMMAQLNLPDLQNAVSAALTAFLDNPKSLTISAKPAAPVAFPMIMGAAMGAPNTLPQMLGATVTAND